MVQDLFETYLGKSIGNYCLEKMVRQNVLGASFLARASTTGERFVLRLLPVPAQLPAEQRLVLLGRLQHEASRIARLQHPAIVPLVEYGSDQQVFYLVTPYISTRYTLNAYLQQHGQLDLARAGRYLDPISSVLEYAHSQGVLHGNLTTYNIFVLPESATQGSSILIAELGIASLQLLEAHSEVWMPLYGWETSAPEQRSGQLGAAATDVYALGALLYRMVTGRPLVEIPAVRILPVMHWRPDVPSTFDTLIARATERDQSRRYQHPAELLEAYRQISPSPWSATAISARLVRTDRANAGFKNNSRAVRPVTRRTVLAALTMVGTAMAVTLALTLRSEQQPVARALQTPSASVRGSGGTPEPSHHVIAHSGDLPLNSALTFPFSGSSNNNPGILIHLPDNTFVAFDSTCTHAGCAVDYQKKQRQLVCPCHGAVFDPARQAKVVQGPATTPLASIKITVGADGAITTA